MHCMRKCLELAACCAAVSIIAFTAVPEAAAKGTGGGPPNGGETTGNNLSVPVYFTGGGIALRGTSGEYTFDGPYWYGWIDGSGVQVACDPSVDGCPPEGVDLYRIYLQKELDNTWQAQTVVGNGVTSVDYLDWSDNLESQTWTASSMIRVETVPFRMDNTLLGFETWWATGLGVDEMWGARATNPAPDPDDPTQDSEPATPVSAYYPGFATIHDSSAWLTMQKLEAGGGSINSPPDTDGLAWEAASHQWVVAGPEDAVTFAPYTPPDFPAAYTAELNIGGKLIFGHVWNLKRTVMTEGVTKDGWWRLTFSTDSCLIDFTATTQLGPPPLPGEASVAEEGETTAYTAVIDPGLDITYIDIYIAGAKGGGKRL